METNFVAESEVADLFFALYSSLNFLHNFKPSLGLFFAFSSKLGWPKIGFNEDESMNKTNIFVLFILSSSLNPILGQPNLLEKAKNNPSEGLKLCKKFKEEYNAKNKSATSDSATKFVSKKNNLSLVNAEFYSIYVIGLYCPEIY